MKKKRSSRRILTPAVIAALVVGGLIIGISYFGSGKSGTLAGTEEKVVFVATNGRDENDGSQGLPVRSMQRAAQMVEGSQNARILLVGPTYDVAKSAIRLAQVGNVYIQSADPNKPTLIIGGDQTDIQVRTGTIEVSNLAFDSTPLGVRSENDTNKSSISVVNNTFSGRDYGNGGYLLVVVAVGNCTVNVNNNKFSTANVSGMRNTALLAETGTSGSVTVANNAFTLPLAQSGNASRRFAGIAASSPANGSIQITGNTFQTTPATSAPKARTEWWGADSSLVGIITNQAANIRVLDNKFTNFHGLDVINQSASSSQNVTLQNNKS